MKLSRPELGTVISICCSCSSCEAALQGGKKFKHRSLKTQIENTTGATSVKVLQEDYFTSLKHINSCTVFALTGNKAAWIQPDEFCVCVMIHQK